MAMSFLGLTAGEVEEGSRRDDELEAASGTMASMIAFLVPLPEVDGKLERGVTGTEA